MDGPIIRPESYPDADARGTDRNLSNLLRQKWYYYGGNLPNPPSEQAKTLTQTKFRNTVISSLVILAKQQVMNAQSIFEKASIVITNIYSLNPYILATSLHIVTQLRLEKLEEVEAPGFKRLFEDAFDRDWPHLYSQLSKIQTKGGGSRSINAETQKGDVLRYVLMYISHKENE